MEIKKEYIENANADDLKGLIIRFILYFNGTYVGKIDEVYTKDGKIFLSLSYTTQSDIIGIDYIYTHDFSLDELNEIYSASDEDIEHFTDFNARIIKSNNNKALKNLCLSSQMLIAIDKIKKYAFTNGICFESLVDSLQKEKEKMGNVN